MQKLKVLYISSVIPDKSCGARIAIFRHLVLKNDFEVALAGYDIENEYILKQLNLKKKYLAERLAKSRFSRVYYNFEYLLNWYWLPRELLRFTKEFQPDVIFTVPDNTYSGFAYQLSIRLNIPLAVDFQDLFPLSMFIPKYAEPYSVVRQFLTKKFNFIHEYSHASFYTSEGMQQYFGTKQNGYILYPIGDFNRPEILPIAPDKLPTKLTIVYAGNCYGAYGKLLWQFAQIVKNSTTIQLKIFPVGRDWTDQQINELITANIYQSFLPFEKLRLELEKADAFLTVMSFDEAESFFVKTSFTTKWLDYAPYGKPIFVWSPKYASASIFAKKYDCGVVTNTLNPSDLKISIELLADNITEWNKLGANARKASDSILNPNTIHQTFVNGLNVICKKC